MTYMNDTHLSATDSDSNTEADPSTVEKLKTLATESTERSKRILTILRQAFSETREEFQAGRTVISPLAQEVTTEAVSTFKEKGQQAADAVNKAWKDEADAPEVTERVVAFLKAMAQTAKENLFPTVEKQVKQQASKLDDVLDNRYGDRYATVKDRFEVIRSWVITEPVDTAATEQVVNDTKPTVIEVDSEVVQ